MKWQCGVGVGPRPVARTFIGHGSGCWACGGAGVLATIKWLKSDLAVKVFCTECRKIILGRDFYRQPGNDRREELKG